MKKCIPHPNIHCFRDTPRSLPHLEPFSTFMQHACAVLQKWACMGGSGASCCAQLVPAWTWTEIGNRGRLVMTASLSKCHSSFQWVCFSCWGWVIAPSHIPLDLGEWITAPPLPSPGLHISLAYTFIKIPSSDSIFCQNPDMYNIS